MTSVRESEALLEAATAVLARWDTPNWKDAGPTAELMSTLRTAVDAARTSANPTPAPKGTSDV